MRVALVLLGCLALAAAPPPEPPSPFRMNQVGFTSNRPATIILVAPETTPLHWTLNAPSGNPGQSGETTVTGEDPASGQHPHRIALAAMPPGEGYTLAAGPYRSRPFSASADPFAGLVLDALSFFYQQRSGTPIEAARVQRPDLARPAGHAPDRAACYAGRDQAGIDWPGCPGKVDATGGWYDAGDQGKYVVNGGIAVWTLLNAAERDRALGRAPVPGLLDEARWEVSFFLKMQIPVGTTLSLRHADGHFAEADAGGLAFAKVADANWTMIPLAPADDPQPRVIHPPTLAATLNLAAVTAQAARLWHDTDPGFAARCLAAARAAFAAAERFPDLAENVAAPGSGAYQDADTSDERFWAAAELFATTGEPAYQAVIDASPFHARPGREISWSNTETAGNASLALGPPGPERDTAHAALLAQADQYRAERDRSGYAIPYAGTDYVWGSNSVILNRALILGLAHALTGRGEYRQAETDALDYVLGRNALDQSYVTGYGARPMRDPHHRFWAHVADERFPAPPPGVLSGGPNSHRAGNLPLSMAASTDCAPMACWHDDHRVFTENEVAINWNAPLVWVASDLAP